MTTKSSYAPVESVREDHGESAGSQHHRTETGILHGDWWWAEILCAVIGTVLIIALCLVLNRYDGKPSPTFGEAFGSALTINTIVAILGTAAKAALLYPVAECVGQLKWIWFSKKHRSLNDMATFDQASRGIWGGLELLWTTKLTSIASLGAVLMVLGIAFDPFTQQLLSFQIQNQAVDTSRATIGVATGWVGDDSGQQNTWIISGSGGIPRPTEDTALSTKLKGVVQMGLNNNNESVLELEASCPGGNCTFDPYWSLSVCTSLTDVSEHLYIKNVSTPDGEYPYDDRWYITPHHFISTGLAFINITAASFGSQDDNGGPQVVTFGDSIAYKDVNSPIADALVIVANGTRLDETNSSHLTYAAYEVMMEWCVQQYNTSVTNGTSSTVLLDSHGNFTADPGYFLTSTFNNTGKQQYDVSNYFHYSLQKYFQTLLNGTATLGLDQYWYTSSNNMPVFFEPFNVWQDHLTSQVWSMSNGIKGTNATGLKLTLDNIATSMSNYNRKSAAAYGLSTTDGFFSQSAFTNGTVWENVNVVVIRWKWIAAHVIFTALSLLLLAVTATLQHFSQLRGEAWKTSSLAVLHALDPDLQQKLAGIKGTKDMSSQDAGQIVRLRHTAKDGWRLMAKHDEDVPLTEL